MPSMNSRLERLVSGLIRMRREYKSGIGGGRFLFDMNAKPWLALINPFFELPCLFIHLYPSERDDPLMVNA